MKNKSKYDTVSVDYSSVTPDQWLALSKHKASKIFSKASATWVDEATPETLRDAIVNAFLNELILMDMKALIKEDKRKAKLEEKLFKAMNSKISPR